MMLEYSVWWRQERKRHRVLGVPIAAVCCQGIADVCCQGIADQVAPCTLRYPTIKLMGGSLKQPVTFDRDRTVQGIVEFLEHHVPEEAVKEEAVKEEAVEEEEAAAAAEGGAKAEL